MKLWLLRILSAFAVALALLFPTAEPRNQVSAPEPTEQNPVKPPTRSRLDKAQGAFSSSRSRVTQVQIVKRYAKWYAKKHHGYTKRQFQMLDEIWTQESHWNWEAENKSSGAWGIAQMMMKSRVTSPFRQVQLGLKYIEHRYGSIDKAYLHKLEKGWY